MKNETSQNSDRESHPFGPGQPAWRRWLLRVVMISVLFVGLMSAFSVLGLIVDQFFITIYVD